MSSRENETTAVVALTQPAACPTDLALDLATMRELRQTLGAQAFDEAFEDAMFEVAERLARIEDVVLANDLLSAKRVAETLTTAASSIGLSGVSSLATRLAEACAKPENLSSAVAARAIAARLMRVGEECLVSAAEMSVEIGERAEGA